ncbi:MAG: FmdE family protein [Roseiflexus sp.]|nr:FmdE family protein [Roseiflexus sp.]MCS7287551.1 FmdE family protein [Roseiflexus sp.]MDW8148578.1 FmdE family protein [Roseiflexaceae bacterium]MDW8231772.1 FmdE family protein [Roseiflexaceae bacterium]
MMETTYSNPLLDDILERSAALHRHLCPRQVLGARMGILAGRLLGLELPQTNKRLLTFVETDGCFADGVGAATGCWLGRRTMRLIDHGKVAATFVDTRTRRAVRIRPHPQARTEARRYAPHARSRWHAYLDAYRVMPDDALLEAHWVELNLDLDRLISRPGVRVVCDRCGEEIINEREVHREGQIFCRGCAFEGERYVTMATAIPAQDRSSHSHLRGLPRPGRVLPLSAADSDGQQ